MEILISLVILGIFMSGLFGLIGAGDRMKGKHVSMRYAIVLAENESEILKNLAASANGIEDAVYYKTVNGITFEVTRKVIEKDESEEEAAFLSKEVEITVKRISDEKPLLTFRLLQGSI
jgi:hypothetical protein